MKARSLADLKRLPVGTRLRLVHRLNGPCDILLTIEKMQGNAWKSDRGWHTFQPAKAYTFTDEGFAVDFGNGARSVYKYEAGE